MWISFFITQKPSASLRKLYAAFLLSTLAKNKKQLRSTQQKLPCFVNTAVPPITKLKSNYFFHSSHFDSTLMMYSPFAYLRNAARSDGPVCCFCGLHI